MLDTIQSKRKILTGDILLLLYHHSWTTFMTCMAFRASRGKCSKSLPLQYSRWVPGLEAGSQIATNCRDGPKNANACSCPSLHTPHLASKMRWSGEWCNHRASILSLNKTRKMQPIKWWSNFQHKFKKNMNFVTSCIIFCIPLRWLWMAKLPLLNSSLGAAFMGVIGGWSPWISHASTSPQ